MGNQFNKACNCGQQITMKKGDDGKWRALNADGGLHRCDAPRTPYKSIHPKNTTVVGQLQRYNMAGAVLLTEGGILHPIAMTEAKYGAWKTVNYPDSEPSHWFEIEVGEDGFMIVSKEIAKPLWGDEAILALKEGRAKPAPAAAPLPHQCKCAGFSEKDKLIVAQVMLKCYTDLWIATAKVEEPKDGMFDEARASILLAVKADLKTMMEM